jgi:hypothetical protein
LSHGREPTPEDPLNEDASVPFRQLAERFIPPREDVEADLIEIKVLINKI